MQLLGRARALQAQGNMASALREYEAAALASGHHPAVASELISAQMSAGKPDAAVRAAKRVVERFPGDARVRLMLAQVLADSGKAQQAIPEVQIARKLDPRMPEAPAIEGALHGMLGDHARSEQCFRDALALQPGHPGLLTNLGHALAAQGELEDAVAPYAQALAAHPEAPTLTAYTGLLSRLGRSAEGIAALEKALLAADDNADLHYALANLYHDQGRLDEAVARHRRALGLKPDFTDAFFNLGMVERDLGRWEAAREAFERALGLDPLSEDHHDQYIIALNRLNELDAALSAAQNAARITGNDKYEITRGHVLRRLGRLDESIAAYRGLVEKHASRADETFWDARANLGLHLLMAGQLREGWREYVWREDRLTRARRDPRVVADPDAFFRAPAGPLPSVFVDIEQGIGDQLFFLRWAPAAARHFARFAVLLDPKLCPLVRRRGGAVEVVDDPNGARECQVQIWLSDLTLALPDAYPPAVTFEPTQSLVEEARALLARTGPPPYIGVTWRAGAKAFETDDAVQRFIKDVEPRSLGDVLCRTAGTVVILQRGMLPREGDAFVAGLGRSAFDFGGYSDDLERMLALLSLLDEYVTVSNTNVHLLAGLPGGSARVLVPYPPEWRWSQGADQSPWFPGFFVYRQHRVHGWTDALVRLQKDLSERWGAAGADTATPALVPVVPATRFSRDNPSPRYRELVGLYGRMHDAGDASHGIPADQMFPGVSFPPQAKRIRALIEKTGASTLLDYGCGKGKQYEWRDFELPGVGRVSSAQDYLGVERIRCYDPGYAPHSALPEGRFDGVIATDVLEHCPEEDLEWIIAEMFSFARRFVFANVASYPARKVLPNGQNAHITQRSPKFWREMFQRAGELHPEVEWEVYVAIRSPAAGAVDRRVTGKGQQSS
jgi:tetratricopeptide (TPR) repeat protein